MKPSIKELKNKHLNKPIAVLGSGADLKKDLEEIPDNCITITANDKPLIIKPDPDYIFVISKALAEKVWKTTDATKIVRISTLVQYSDYIADRESIWYGAPGAGALATSLALFLGGNPVLLCGFDLFRKSHCDGVKRDIVETKLDIEFFLNKWSKIFNFYTNACNIKAVGDSPLYRIFGKYNCNDK